MTDKYTRQRSKDWNPNAWGKIPKKHRRVMKLEPGEVVIQHPDGNEYVWKTWDLVLNYQGSTDKAGYKRSMPVLPRGAVSELDDVLDTHGNMIATVLNRHRMEGPEEALNPRLIIDDIEDIVFEHLQLHAQGKVRKMISGIRRFFPIDFDFFANSDFIPEGK